MTAAAEALAALREAFRDVPRPDGLFIHGTCLCGECQEHNATLAAKTPDDITLAELGNPGWDPMCFANKQAFAYYLPAMVRLAFADTYYMDQLGFHLTIPGRVDALAPPHAAAVLRALWAWAEINLDKVADDWNATGEAHRFEDALRRLEARAGVSRNAS
jgi:hypothetical protein